MYYAIGFQIVIIAMLICNGDKYIKRLLQNRKRSILCNTNMERQPVEITRDLAVAIILQHVFIVPGIKEIHHNPDFFVSVLFTLAGMAILTMLLRIYVVNRVNSRLSDTILNYTVATVFMYITLILYFSIPVIYVIKQLLTKV